MIVRASNPNIDQNERTYLTADVVATNTSLSVQNNEGYAANDYVVIEKFGDEQAELRKIASVSGNGTIVTDALTFAHSIDAPVTFIKYNKVAVYSASSKTGSYAALAASPYDIEEDQEFTEIEDTSGTSSTWYKIRFWNSTLNQYSDYSDPIQGSGYEDNSVRAIMDRIYIIGTDPERKIITEEEMLTILNDGYRKAIARVMAEDPKFYLKKAYADIVNSYITGTVAVTDGGTTVTGTGTTWTSAMVGRKIIFGGEGYAYEVATAPTATSLTLTTAYNGSGSNLSSSAYVIYQDEYSLYLDGTTTALTDFRSIYKVLNEDGRDVTENDMKRDITGYYVKRVGDNFKFCLNYISANTNVGGKWTVHYIYQPARFDSVGDVPELPLGFDDVLFEYGLYRLKQRMGDKQDASISKSEFKDGMESMVRRGTKRSGVGRSFRLPKKFSHSGVMKDPDFTDTFMEV